MKKEIEHIRSEKAISCLGNNRYEWNWNDGSSDPFISEGAAFKAILLAENDARERAAKAWCAMCREDGGRHNVYHQLGGNALNCVRVKQFLNHYDE